MQKAWKNQIKTYLNVVGNRSMIIDISTLELMPDNAKHEVDKAVTAYEFGAKYRDIADTPEITPKVTEIYIIVCLFCNEC